MGHMFDKRSLKIFGTKKEIELWNEKLNQLLNEELPKDSKILLKN
jgi:hypothetical protein